MPLGHVAEPLGRLSGEPGWDPAGQGAEEEAVAVSVALGGLGVALGALTIRAAFSVPFDPTGSRSERSGGCGDEGWPGSGQSYELVSERRDHLGDRQRRGC